MEQSGVLEYLCANSYLEDILLTKKAQVEIMSSPENRTELHKVVTELKRFLILGEEF